MLHGVPMPNGQLLTSPQVAQRLGCSVRTVHRLVDSEELKPAQKLPGPNGAFLFDQDDVETLKKARDGASPAYATSP